MYGTEDLFPAMVFCPVASVDISLLAVAMPTFSKPVFAPVAGWRQAG